MLLIIVHVKFANFFCHAINASVFVLTIPTSLTSYICSGEIIMHLDSKMPAAELSQSAPPPYEHVSATQEKQQEVQQSQAGVTDYLVPR